jgi:pheromone shutdown protein TraB
VYTTHFSHFSLLILDRYDLLFGAPSTSLDESACEMKHTFPASLLKQLTILKSRDARHTVYLIGTGHISKKSAESVREIIKIVKPKAVFLEMCESRRKYLQPILNDKRDNAEMSYLQELDGLRTGKTNPFHLLHSRMARIPRKHGITAGGDFLAGYEAAKECGASVILGDRNVGITSQRAWQGLTLLEKAKYGIGMALSIRRESSVSKEKFIKESEDTDLVGLAREISTGPESPWTAEAVLFERDLYMLHRLTETLQSFDGEDSCDVVAVVGNAHVFGIAQRWNMEIKYPGSELSPGNISDVLKIPGPTTDANHISYEDFR